MNISDKDRNKVAKSVDKSIKKLEQRLDKATKLRLKTYKHLNAALGLQMKCSKYGFLIDEMKLTVVECNLKHLKATKEYEIIKSLILLLKESKKTAYGKS